MNACRHDVKGMRAEVQRESEEAGEGKGETARYAAGVPVPAAGNWAAIEVPKKAAVSKGRAPNLSCRGGRPSLAASSGFDEDESVEVEVHPLPFLSRLLASRPNRSRWERS